MKAGQDVTAKIRAELSSAVFLPQDNTLGNAYLSVLDLGGAPSRFASRLPQVDATGIVRKDLGGQTRTGNIVLFAERIAFDSYITGGGRLYSTPLYRPDGLDLNHWVSEVLADGAAIDEVTSPTDLTALLEHLRTDTVDDKGRAKEPIEVAWRVGADPSAVGTLRMLGSGGTLSDTPSGARGMTWKLLADRRRSRFEMFAQPRLSIASNWAPSRMGLARFGDMLTSGLGFPHGLEVQIVGPSSARQILVHLVLVEAGATTSSGFARQQVVAYTPHGTTS
jgi:hypothetical protein